MLLHADGTLTGCCSIARHAQLDLLSALELTLRTFPPTMPLRKGMRAHLLDDTDGTLTGCYLARPAAERPGSEESTLACAGEARTSDSWRVRQRVPAGTWRRTAPSSVGVAPTHHAVRDRGGSYIPPSLGTSHSTPLGRPSCSPRSCTPLVEYVL